MIVVIGAGISGLLLSKRVKADLILEEQPVIGGVFASDNVFGKDLPYVLPIINDPAKLPNIEFNYLEYDLKLSHRKYDYFEDKICKYCDKLPTWLNFGLMRKLYVIENITAFIDNLSKNVRIIKEYPIRIDDKKIITNKGNMYKYTRVYNTASLKKMYKLLGVDSSNLKHKAALTLLILTRKTNNKNWNVYLSGDTADSFSVVIKLDNIIKDLDLYYVYSFMDITQKSIDIDRVMLDLKRRQIISLDEIIAFRSKLISEALLFGEINHKITLNMVNCGRLGEWKNYDVIETISRIQNC
ncbi:hypothetical protein SULI_05740 [Saccharolobus solfataricus]|uniref:NAD(P)/FAD-dependent oxidoreductase n=3 Tax=Saccharolobus solfataricus TaxID=2287 RepID=Q980X7_SACS2|nr:FAD/NAD(P)-binding protein [Saccharolobus solfataricus]AAK40495.1 Hypothetical protein SSO0147 [Saccharolobus solfataricus P2]AKA73480.1 hypothetical protein SULB_1164 [Saccharolobus solfataricus]AKA76178.1 hypothetical protein SULC_1162 [Saccharolobus solfataricus]AKA78870.1 hypothetical protein SULA_1163 [Saccharolobus solfataricus]AZF67947.1 hypothetical protein SULG_05740 [Saccharolobus solfataricus]